MHIFAKLLYLKYILHFFCVAEILNHLLEHRNHPRIRIIGFQLLLLWLNDQTIELAEAVRLYANAISLDLFVYDHINSVEKTFDSNEGSITLQQELIKGACDATCKMMRSNAENSYCLIMQ